MTFTNWLFKQADRTDDVGWLSRLIKSSTESQKEIELSGDVKKYAESMQSGKIRSAMLKSCQEWSATLKIAGRPQIGIFWIVNGQIMPFEADANTVQVVAGFKDAPFDHYSTWPQMQKVYPNFRNKEYDEIPRGRVIGLGVDRYRIFLSPADAKNQTLVSRVMGEFSLPRGKTEVMPDNHYVIGQAIDDVFDDDDEVDPFD